VVQERLARAVEDGLIAGRVQIVQLALQRLVVQPMRIEAELPAVAVPFRLLAAYPRSVRPPTKSL
jgi:hypothetical protein